MLDVIEMIIVLHPIKYHFFYVYITPDTSKCHNDGVIAFRNGMFVPGRQMIEDDGKKLIVNAAMEIIST